MHSTTLKLLISSYSSQWATLKLAVDSSTTSKSAAASPYAGGYVLSERENRLLMAVQMGRLIVLITRWDCALLCSTTSRFFSTLSSLSSYAYSYTAVAFWEWIVSSFVRMICERISSAVVFYPSWCWRICCFYSSYSSSSWTTSKFVRRIVRSYSSFFW